ncbi:PREDICTED: small G protein signaling modulator 1-like isoform X1 [Nicrophorus vespilloides]|uniref:Small G protein signaling modulator 1-like isoform X1 n=1 Tax=Nicrophorus vespilloides TaxID=110193 RepID=A0ABM1MJW5_NICVS|nr:PREDICTED: small G protein signaling modulator 1-like isoform X1 [Nicrophorus vespilloides]
MSIIKNEKDYKGKLVAAVKKEVKQVMEESVTRKFVHEESGSVTSLCGAVEACLSQGLRRRALGLFKTSSTTALLHKIAKHSEEAANISRKVQDIESSDPNRKSSSSSDSLTLKKNLSVQSAGPPAAPKYLWIRLALFEKQLAKIIDYLVTNAGKYYDKDAVVADSDYGTILSSLLVGPCALDYTRTKTQDHFWTDPPADELLQRHRISSGHSTPPSARRPMLNFRRSLNTSAEDSTNNRTSTSHYAKDYVESLHQNSRATLLFGKNNVLVLPVNAPGTDPLPGYLSLHQSAHNLTIKWTPNQLMNGFAEEVQDKSVYWDYALQVRMDEIVYVHCHQDAESGGTIILVGQDGVQRPPILFPKGGHMLSFLSCIETGLLPRGRLDPPLWSQHSGVSTSARKKRPLPAITETTKDYVFRIIDNADKEILKRNELLDTKTPLPSRVRVQLASSSTSSESSTKSFSIDAQPAPESPPSVCIKAVCDSMKRQIISRAFYGWLAYCRHLSTVRTHLSGLVNWNIINGDGADEGITVQKWSELCVEGVVKDSNEVFRLAYFGGVANELRMEIWPYLLRHYKFGSNIAERNRLNEETRLAYENRLSEWLAVEAIVKQRDKECQAIAIAKLSSDSVSVDQLPQMQRDLSNEVFEAESAYPLHNSFSNEEDEHDFSIHHNVIVTDASVDIPSGGSEVNLRHPSLNSVNEEERHDNCLETHGLISSTGVSPVSSNGGIYTVDLLNDFGEILHKIEKDVQRCDRNHWYFAGENLDKLRNIMCTYAWEHMHIGYMQGMCDLVAPLLVMFDDESLTYACFCHLMERMIDNFPYGNAMDCNFANMRSLVQILDSEMYELMLGQRDNTHFYFCYRWFMLDFKRELLYPDIFSTWEVIWAAQRVASNHFVLFLAMAMLETYRDVILSNSMDFTDIIKFFNEMAERHDAAATLRLARDLVMQLQLLIENK